MTSSDNRAGRMRRVGVAALVAAIGLAGTYVFRDAVQRVQPMDGWLFWSLAKIWGALAAFNAAAWAFGQLLLTRLLRLSTVPPLERAALSACLGIFAFAAALFGAGVFGGFTAEVAVALPAVMLLAAASTCAREFTRPRGPAAPAGVFATLATFGGVIAAFLLYLQSFTPDALNYDAAWMHVKFAEDYARHGRLIPFPSSYHGGLPHLASILYTWAYLIPGLELSEHWMLVLHLEFSVVLWTLCAVAATVQRMLGRFDVRGSWAAFWLFPGIFVYDNNLGGAADHVLAFFSTCVVLAMLRVVRSFNTGACVALTVASAAALLTKYQAFYVLVPVALIIAVAWLRAWQGASDAGYRRALLRAPLWMLGCGALLLLPHFAKNWVYYHNPVYPLMQHVFTHSTPSVPGGTVLVEKIYTDSSWIPAGDALDRFKHALGLFGRFSFQPHYSFIGSVPVFGSLFTLLLPVVLLLRSRRRIALVALVGSVAILLWGYTYNVDRNLQTFMPVLASVVGAVLIEGWQLGALARIGLIPLVGLQLVWGADAAILSGRDRIASAFSLITSTFDHRAEIRFEGFRPGFRLISAALPRNAQVLLHTSHVSLGIDRDIIQDWAGYQGLISYGNLRTPAELFNYYRSLGVTHLLDEANRRSAPTKQEEVLYQTFVQRHAKGARHLAGYRLFTMPHRGPTAEAPYQVLCAGLSFYDDGLYPIEQLNVMEYLPGYLQSTRAPRLALAPGKADELLARADAIVCAPANCEALLAGKQASYQQVVNYPGQFAVFVPRR